MIFCKRGRVVCDSPSLRDQRRSFSLVSTSRGATRLQKITVSEERRTYVPKVSALCLTPLIAQQFLELGPAEFGGFELHGDLGQLFVQLQRFDRLRGLHQLLVECFLLCVEPHDALF